jgi:prophage regulatory protein
MTPSQPFRILRRHEVARMIGVSPLTISRWAKQGVMPPQLQIGPAVVGWKEADLLEWIERRRIEAEAKVEAEKKRNS